MCCRRFFRKSLSTHLFLSYLSNLRTRNEFTDLLSMFAHIISLGGEIVHYCGKLGILSSFAARSCDACFSQIFEKRTFGRLNEDEESLFMTLRTFDSFCRSCASSATLNSRILLTVVTAYLNQLGLDNNMWPIFVTQMLQNCSLYTL